MSLTHPHVRIAEGQLSTAEVNAGTTIVAPQVDRTITVVDAWARAIGGAAGSNTSVDVVDTTTGTVAVAFGQAALTQNTVVRAGASNTTATNLLAALGEDEGLAIVNNGTDMDTATHLDYFVWYVVTEANR